MSLHVDPRGVLAFPSAELHTHEALPLDKTLPADERGPAGRDPTWVFERAGQRIELHRSESSIGALLVISGADAPRSYQFSDATAAARFQSDMEAFLLKTGWSFSQFLPDRRSVADRRTWPRLTERRRWWTDGLLRRYIRHRSKKQP